MTANIKNLKLIISKLEKGFTLTELLVVIAILGVLMAALLAGIDPVTQVKKSKDARIKSDIRQIQQALEMYKSDVGLYPIIDGNLGTCNTSFTSIDGTIYLRNIPCNNPVDGGNYKYVGTGPSYTISSCINNNRDPEGEDNVGVCGTQRREFVAHNP